MHRSRFRRLCRGWAIVLIALQLLVPFVHAHMGAAPSQGWHLHVGDQPADHDTVGVDAGLRPSTGDAWAQLGLALLPLALALPRPARRPADGLLRAARAHGDAPPRERPPNAPPPALAPPQAC